MRRRQWIQGMTAAALPAMAGESGDPALTVILNAEVPAKSRGTFRDGSSFRVGFGRDGYLEANSSFVGGSSLLGEFRVNAILTMTQFEMEDSLVESSGKSRDWLAANLFRNMSSIDFDGDGAGGEYGEAFIGLDPVESPAEQPFHFGEYRGVFRWYSYAIHGTQDEDRIGKCITGGCINVGRGDLMKLVATLRLGDRVLVKSSAV